ncbi:hypothetical protein [Azospirillum soli]|uniref:hypothetical protein n=1 Tax=Azospirillum soli TaxID=1304799 RepID=UPI001AE3C8C8|nr:hypothetical protein [Azospirillum soli]MBP2315088.1 hypothetical protein [Azospirillum soli]
MGDFARAATSGRHLPPILKRMSGHFGGGPDVCAGPSKMEQSMSNEVEKKSLASVFDEVRYRNSEVKSTNSDETKKLSVAKRCRVYQLIADAYAAGLLALEPDRVEELAKELIRHQVKSPKEGQNKWLALVSCMFGEFQEDKDFVSFMGSSNLVPWKRDRSAEKYAYVMAYLEKMGVTPDRVVQYIENFSNDRGKKLNGIIATWTELYGERRSVAEKSAFFKSALPKGAHIIVVDCDGKRAKVRGTVVLPEAEKMRIVNSVKGHQPVVSSDDVSKVGTSITGRWISVDKEQIVPRAVERAA